MAIPLTTPILVTGANGFIGQTLVTKLVEAGWSVVAGVRPGQWPRVMIHPRVKVVDLDLTQPASVRTAVPNQAVIINLAANPYHPDLSHQVNVQGLETLLRVAEKKSARLFVQVSSQATKIAKPGIYGQTKQAADQLVQAAKIPWLIIKPSLICGPGDQGLFAKIKKLSQKLPFLPMFGDGKTTMYPLAVTDFSALIIKMISDTKLRQQIVDVGGSQKISYRQLYETLAQRPNGRIPVISLPIWLGLLLAKLTSWMKNPPFVRDNILGSTQDTHCQPRPILKRYNFQPLRFATEAEKIIGLKRKKIAIVGLGKMGLLHATILQTFQDVEIVALVDPQPKLAGTFQSLGIKSPVYAELKQALSNHQLDAVYVTTPTFTHLPLLKEVSQHRLAIFIEKPLALNQAELKQLQHLKFKAPIQVGYTLLFHRTFWHAKQLINHGRLGKLQQLQASFRHSEVLAARQGWMFNPKLAGGGVLMNPGPHLFSVIAWMFGQGQQITSELEKIFSAEVEDRAKINLEYPQAQGSLSLSWSEPGQNVADYQLRAQFSQGELLVNPQLLSYKLKNQPLATKNFWELAPPQPDGLNLNPEAYGEAFYLENRQFVNSLHQVAAAPINTLQVAITAESMIHQAYAHSSWRSATIHQ